MDIAAMTLQPTRLALWPDDAAHDNPAGALKQPGREQADLLIPPKYVLPWQSVWWSKYMKTPFGSILAPGPIAIPIFAVELHETRI